MGKQSQKKAERRARFALKRLPRADVAQMRDGLRAVRIVKRQQ